MCDCLRYLDQVRLMHEEHPEQVQVFVVAVVPPGDPRGRVMAFAHHPNLILYADVQRALNDFIRGEGL